MAGIVIKNLTQKYADTVGVDNINLEIKNGEFFVFVGPSGSGKSTLLRLIAGLIKPVSGIIQFDERKVTRLEPRDRNVSMVFQNYALYPHKNVYDNIAFGLRARKVPEKTVEDRVGKAVSMLGIAPLVSRWPKELSGGERQRVAIGRAIVRDPEVYLLDEPLSNLDARLRLEMRNEIAKIHQQVKTTFIYVTHDQIEAMTLGTRIAVINKGKIEQVDTPENLYDYPVNRFVAGFIGAPSMNFLPGKFQRWEGRPAVSLYGGTITLNGRGETEFPFGEGEDIVLGIRPEAVNLDDRREGAAAGHIIRVEPVGHEGFIYLKIAGENLVARVNEWRKYKNRDSIPLGFDLHKVYVFSASDERCRYAKGRII